MTGSILTTSGKQIIIDRTFNSPTYSFPSQFQFGCGTTTQTDADTKLSQYSHGVTQTIIEACDALTGWSGESGNETLTLNNTTYHSGTGAINLAKTGTGGANAGMTKTITSLDFTNKSLAVWVYIRDIPTLNKLLSFDIRLNSAGGEYLWLYNTNKLVMGWNLIGYLTPGNSNLTFGTPTITAMTSVIVQFYGVSNATTWAAGDLIVDEVSTFTTVKDATINITNTSGFENILITNTLAFGEGNNQLVSYFGGLTEYGLFNKDNPIKMFDHTVMPAITKTSGFQLNFEEMYIFNS